MRLWDFDMFSLEYNRGYSKEEYKVMGLGCLTSILYYQGSGSMLYLCELCMLKQN